LLIKDDILTLNPLQFDLISILIYFKNNLVLSQS